MAQNPSMNKMQTGSLADQLELQKLEEQRRELDRKIALLKSSSAPSLPLSPLSSLSSPQAAEPQQPLQPSVQIPTHHDRPQSTVRTRASPAVIPAIRAFPDDEMNSQPMKRAKTTFVQPTSIRESVPMDRSSSTRPIHSNPFSGPGIVTPPQAPCYLQQYYRHGGPMIENYSRDADQAPISESLFSHSMQAGGPHSSPPTGVLPCFPGEHVVPDVGMTVVDYLQGHGSVLADSSAWFDVPEMQHNTHDVVGQRQSICGSLTTAPTLEDLAMSRRNSVIPNDGASVTGQLPVGMIRLASQSSFDGSNSPDAHSSSQFPEDKTRLDKLAPPSNQHDFFQIGANPTVSIPLPCEGELFPPPAVYHSTPMAHSGSNQSIDIGFTQMPDCAQTDINARSLTTPFEAASADMERTQSNASSRSSQSLNLRAKEAIKRQNQNAIKAPKLQPKPWITLKPGSTDEAKDRSGAGTPASTFTTPPFTTPPKPGKTAIAAPKKYERPKHPKVHCTKCPDRPEFRGEHELRRHTDAKHKSTTSKWVCRDPRTADPTAEFEGPVPIQPLDQCKHCKGKKLYGAYYNAAAHLRRTHFKEKPVRSRNAADKSRDDGSAKKSDAVVERRAGHGGGDWPSMDVLKLWMEEIKVKAAGSDEDDEEEPVQCEQQDAIEEEEEETDADAESEPESELESEPESEPESEHEHEHEHEHEPEPESETEPELEAKGRQIDFHGLHHEFYTSASFASGADVEITLDQTSFPLLNHGLPGSHMSTLDGLDMRNSVNHSTAGLPLSSANFSFYHPIGLTAMNIASCQLQATGIMSSPSTTTTATITPGGISDTASIIGSDRTCMDNNQNIHPSFAKQMHLGDTALVATSQSISFSPEFSFETLFQADLE